MKVSDHEPQNRQSLYIYIYINKTRQTIYNVKLDTDIDMISRQHGHNHDTDDILKNIFLHRIYYIWLHWNLFSGIQFTMSQHFADGIFKFTFFYENYDIWFKFNQNLFPVVQYTISAHCSGKSLVPDRWQAIIWSNDGLVYWRMYASFELNELKKPMRCRPSDKDHWTVI